MADETRTIAWQLVVETKGIEANTARASASLNQLTNSVKGVATGLAAIAAGTVARSLVDFSDTFTRVQNTVRLATNSLEEFNATQAALVDAARGSFTSLETTARNYANLRNSLENYRVTGRQVIELADTITKAVKLQGGSAEQAEAAVKRMAYAFETGTVSTKELNTMIKQTPELAKALAAALTDGSVPALRQLAKDGKLTGQALLDGLSGAADQINDKFAKRVPTISEAFTNLKTTLLDVFGAAIAEQIQQIAEEIKKFGEALPGIIATFQELGIRVKYGWELTLNDVKNLWEILKAYVVKYVADIGAILVGLIPNWAADLSPQVAAFRQHYTELAQIKQADLDKARKTYEQTNGFIYTNMQTALKAVQQTKAGVAAAGGGILDQVIGGGAGMPELEVSGFSEFRKALDALNGELLKVRDRTAAVSIAVTAGAQASKEYAIAAEARRRIDEQILAAAAAGKAFPEDQANALRALSAAVANANIELSRYENAQNLVLTAIDAGKTSYEKAAELLERNAAAFALLQTRVKLTDEQVRHFNETQKDLAEKADPVKAAQTEINKLLQQAQDETDRLAIRNTALAISLRDGEGAARAFINSAEAELAVRRQLHDLAEKKLPVDEAAAQALRDSAQQAADAKTANEALAQAQRLVNDAANYGISSQQQLRERIEDTRTAIDAMLAAGADEKAIAAAQAGLKRMEDSANELKMTFQNAALQMGSALVDFVIDGQQSFKEFAASVIKDIGRMVAQLFMLKAIKTMLGMPFEAGGVIERGNVLPFQHGGVVGGPTTFPLARGAHGLMGEAGPEAVMPLARLPGGDLGVKSQPMNLELINNTGVNATARVKAESDRTQLILEAAELGATWAQSRFNSSVNSGYGASATSLQRTYGLTRRKA